MKLKDGVEYYIKVVSQASGIEVGACEVREILKDGTLGPNLAKKVALQGEEAI